MSIITFRTLIQGHLVAAAVLYQRMVHGGGREDTLRRYKFFSRMVSAFCGAARPSM